MAKIDVLVIGLLGGLISPRLNTNVTDSVAAQGLVRAKNVHINPIGGIDRRAGTNLFFYHVNQLDIVNHGRIIPFSGASADQSFILNILIGKNNNVTIFTKSIDKSIGVENVFFELAGGGSTTTCPISYTESELNYVQYAQNANQITLTSAFHPPLIITYDKNGTVGQKWKGEVFKTTPKLARPVINSVTAHTTTKPADITPADWTLRERDYEYVVVAVNGLQNENSQQSLPVKTDKPIYLYADGARVDIKFNAVTGADKYEIYRKNQGEFLLLNTVQSVDGVNEYTFIDDNKVDVDTTKSLPALLLPKINMENSFYPSCLTYFQQRKFFAGFTEQPLRVIAGRTNSENDLTYHPKHRNTDALTFDIYSTQAQRIYNIAGMEELYVFTDSKVFKRVVRSTDEITPDSIDIKAIYKKGSAPIQVAEIQNGLIFVESSGHTLFSLSHNDSGTAIGSICLRIPELFRKRKIKRIVSASYPYDRLIVLFDDYKVAVCTILLSENLFSWTEYEFDFLVKDLAMLEFGGESVLYMLVEHPTPTKDHSIVTMTFDENRDVHFLDSAVIHQSSTDQTQLEFQSADINPAQIYDTVDILYKDGTLDLDVAVIKSDPIKLIVPLSKPVDYAIIGKASSCEIGIKPPTAKQLTDGMHYTVSSIVDIKVDYETTTGEQYYTSSYTQPTFPKVDKKDLSKYEHWSGIKKTNAVSNWKENQIIYIKCDLPYDFKLNGLIIKANVEINR